MMRSLLFIFINLNLILFQFINSQEDVIDNYVPIKNGYNLPVLPDNFPTKTDLDRPEEIWNKHIPRKIWIAVRDINDDRPGHLKPFAEKNSNWTIHYQGNKEKDEFMERVFNGTSILWAYNILNPAIGTSKVEIWRLAILYTYGGMYMDDDANIDTKFDNIVEDNDKLIFGQEAYDCDDRCYVDEFILSNKSMNERFGSANSGTLLGGKFFFNWAIFSSPRHPILKRIMIHIVTLIKAEYFGNSLIKMHHTDHRGKLLMCATTFPITLATREIVLENNIIDLGLRIGDIGFKQYGADMKAWFNDNSPTHWVKMIHKKRTPYLRSYAPPNMDKYEGKLIQAPGAKEIFMVFNGTKHGFPDFNTFVAMHFDTDMVISIPHAINDQIPLGTVLPRIFV